MKNKQRAKVSTVKPCLDQAAVFKALVFAFTLLLAATFSACRHPKVEESETVRGGPPPAGEHWAGHRHRGMPEKQPGQMHLHRHEH